MILPSGMSDDFLILMQTFQDSICTMFLDLRFAAFLDPKCAMLLDLRCTMFFETYFVQFILLE